MKFKNLETAKKYLSPIFREEKLPTKINKWSEDFTDEEHENFINLWKEDELIEKECFVVSEYSDLYYYENYLAYKIGHSRRGQYYYLLCDVNTLNISIIATTPDGAGSNVSLPDVLITWILNGDVVL